MEMVQTTIKLPEGLIHRIRIRAAIDKRQIGDIVTEALKEWFKHHPGDTTPLARKAGKVDG